MYDEILATERDYVRDLKLLIDAYVRPLQRDAQGLRREEVVRVFSNVEEILDVNELLLGRLEVTAAAERGSGTAAAAAGSARTPAVRRRLSTTHVEAFTESLPLLAKAYGRYCADHMEAYALLAQLTKRSRRFARFVTERAAEPRCRGLDLHAFLIKPVQRLLKYPLFFGELVKHTLDPDAEAPPSPAGGGGGGADDGAAASADAGAAAAAHREELAVASSLRATREALHTLSAQVNGSVDHANSLARVHEVFEKLDHDASRVALVAPTRRFRLEGACVWASASKPPKPHRFFLFNDLLASRLRSGARASTRSSTRSRCAISTRDAPAALTCNGARDHLFELLYEDRGGRSFGALARA